MTRRTGPPAIALLLAFAIAGCDSIGDGRSRHRGEVPPPVPAEVLAYVSTATEWVGGPRHPRDDGGVIGIVVLWNAYDPACRDRIGDVEAWHEAYARYGVRVTALHFAAYPFAADSAVVGRTLRDLGIRFPTAVVPVPPPAALAAGRGPVVVWPGGGDPAPQWLTTGSDVAAFEARIRRRLREALPDAGFPAERILGIERERTPDEAVRTVRLGTGTAERGPIRGATPDQPQPFVTPFRPEQEGSLDTPTPVGWWTPRTEAIEAARGGAANLLAIRYDAGPLGLVAAPPAGSATRVWILEDEKWLVPSQAGEDVRFDARGASYLEVGAPGFYRVTKGGAHVLKLSPEAAGVRFYAFTMEAAKPRP